MIKKLRCYKCEEEIKDKKNGSLVVMLEFDTDVEQDDFILCRLCITKFKEVFINAKHPKQWYYGREI